MRPGAFCASVEWSSSAIFQRSEVKWGEAKLEVGTSKCAGSTDTVILPVVLPLNAYMKRTRTGDRYAAVR